MTRLLVENDYDNQSDDDEEKDEPTCAVNPATSKLFWTAS
jgi:hypothetical protein